MYQNGVAKFVDVVTGTRDSSNVQVLTGINPGDTILITGLLSLKPDAKVMLGKVVNGTNPSPKGGASSPVGDIKEKDNNKKIVSNL